MISVALSEPDITIYQMWLTPSMGESGFPKQSFSYTGLSHISYIASYSNNKVMALPVCPPKVEVTGSNPVGCATLRFCASSFPLRARHRTGSPAEPIAHNVHARRARYLSLGDQLGHWAHARVRAPAPSRP